MDIATSTQLFHDIASTTADMVNGSYGFFIMIIGGGLALTLVLAIILAITRVFK